MGCFLLCVVVHTHGGAAELCFFVNNFTSAPFTWTKKRVVAFRPTTRTRPRLGLMVRCGALALSKKNMPFCAFFNVQQKKQKITPFSFIPKVMAMFEQVELRGIPMGPNGPPNAKETAQIAPEIAILENQAILVIFVILGKNMPFWPFWPPISKARWTSRKQAPLGIRLKSTRRSQIRVYVHVTPHLGENPKPQAPPGVLL